MLIIGAVGIPEVESVTPLGRTPFIPGKLFRVVVTFDVGFVGRIEMPFTDVTQRISFFLKNIRPATLIGFEFITVLGTPGIAVFENAVRRGIFAGQQRSAEGTTQRIVGNCLRKNHAFFSQTVQIGGKNYLFIKKSQCLSSHLVRKNQE
jgi:hypothetical protein